MEIVAPATPKLEWGNGDALNVVDRDNGLDIIVSGIPGRAHAVRGSPNAPPQLQHHPLVFAAGLPPKEVLGQFPLGGDGQEGGDLLPHPPLLVELELLLELAADLGQQLFFARKAADLVQKRRGQLGQPADFDRGHLHRQGHFLAAERFVVRFG